MNRDDNAAPWWELGSCAHLAPEVVDWLFFASGSGRAGRDRQAKTICAACPVVLDCLRYAVRREILVGTYGAMTDLERRKRFHHGARPTHGRTA